MASKPERQPDFVVGAVRRQRAAPYNDWTDGRMDERADCQVGGRAGGRSVGRSGSAPLTSVRLSAGRAVDQS